MDKNVEPLISFIISGGMWLFTERSRKSPLKGFRGIACCDNCVLECTIFLVNQHVSFFLYHYSSNPFFCMSHWTCNL